MGIVDEITNSQISIQCKVKLIQTLPLLIGALEVETLLIMDGFPKVEASDSSDSVWESCLTDI